MKVKELILELKNLKSELQDKDVYVIAENGLTMPPEIKFVLKVQNLEISGKNVEYVVLTSG